MFNISSDIAMAKMFSYSSSKYALPHWGYNRASLSQCNWNFQLFLFSLSCCIFILISSSLFCSFLFNLLLLIGVSLVLIFSINQSSSTTLISFCVVLSVSYLKNHIFVIIIMQWVVFEKHKGRSFNAQNKSSGEMSNRVFETYKILSYHMVSICSIYHLT